MPNRDVHLPVGCAAGGLVTACRARRQSAPDLWLEIVGGVVGGYVGALLPDILDLPTSPNHRSLAHSAGGAALVVWRGKGLLLHWERYFRLLSDQTRARGDVRKSEQAELLYQLLGAFFRISAGFASGFAAGYATHLVLDAQTPKGLPLLA